MQEPTKEIGGIVTVLLAIAAVIANTVANTNIGFILMIILLATCGALAMRYEGRGRSS